MWNINNRFLPLCKQGNLRLIIRDNFHKVGKLIMDCKTPLIKFIKINQTAFRN
jgi:hypothetical protein